MGIIREETQTAHRKRAGLAGQARAPRDVVGDADPPAEEDLRLLRIAEIEESRPLQEELALLLEEEAEAGQVDLDVVGLDLGEVGVEGRVERQVGGDRVLEIEAQVVQGLRRALGLTALARNRAPGDREGLHFHVAPAAQPLEPGQGGVLRDLGERAAELLADVGEVHHLVLAADGALHEDPHLGRLRVGEADGREGDGRFDHPAVVGDDSLALVDALPPPVRQGHRFVGDERVALSAEGVDFEDVRVAPVVICVEADADVVVLVDPAFAVQDAAPDPRRVGVVEHDPEVDVVVVEGDAEFGAFGRGITIDGDALAKVGDGLDRVPEGFVEDAVDGGRLVGAHGAHGGVLRGEGGPRGEDPDRESGSAHQNGRANPQIRSRRPRPRPARPRSGTDSVRMCSHTRPVRCRMSRSRSPTSKSRNRTGPTSCRTVSAESSRSAESPEGAAAARS